MSGAVHHLATIGAILGLFASLALLMAGCHAASISTKTTTTTTTTTTSTTSTAAGTCGTTGGGAQHCVNNPSFTCWNCGFRPCLAQGNVCYSCYGVDGRCYKYDCGNHCSATSCGPDFGTCGTKGSGDQPCANNPHYECYNCGLAPCVDSRGYCYSCYSPQTNSCYKYHCGSHCSTSPCGTDGAERFPALNASAPVHGGDGAEVPAHWVPKARPSAEAAVPELAPSSPAHPGDDAPAWAPASDATPADMKPPASAESELVALV